MNLWISNDQHQKFNNDLEYISNYTKGIFVKDESLYTDGAIIVIYTEGQVNSLKFELLNPNILCCVVQTWGMFMMILVRSWC